MKKRLFLAIGIICLVLFFSSCTKNKELLTIDLPVTENIKGIVVEGPWSVRLQQNDTHCGTIEYRAYLENKISYEIRNNYLYLKVRNSWRPHSKKDLTAYISLKNLEKIEASGASEIIISGHFEQEKIAISVSGASNIKGFSAGGNILTLSLSGASELKDLDFSGDLLDMDLSGASEIKRGKCRVNHIITELAGASSCDIWGNATSGRFDISGASTIHAVDLQMENLTIYLSGASYAEAFVAEILSGKLSGASKLRYRGEANTSGITTEGASSIIRIP